MTKEAILILHNIRSSYNVGSLFRTADCAGISQIYLTGYTPSPIDRFGRSVKEIAKVSLGASDYVSWKKEKQVSLLVERLKKDGFQIVAIEQDQNSVDYKKVKLKEKTAFILGNEVKGIDKKILSKCDVVAEISLKGKKESLNVSVAGGVAIFGMLRI